MKGSNLLPFALAVLVFVSAIGVVQIKHRNRSMTARLDQMRVEQQKLDLEWSQLQLEQAALSQHARVDQLARHQFHMVEPTQSLTVEAHR